MDCQTVRRMMHEYIDGDLSGEDRKAIARHLRKCERCCQHFRELDRTEMFLYADRMVAAPPDFMDKLAGQLASIRQADTAEGPLSGGTKRANGRAWSRWMRRHPFAIAVSLFVVLMGAGFVTAWSEPSSQFSLTTSPDNLAAIEIDSKDRAIRVPKGKVVEGDLVVRGGEVEVYGKVTGNVVAVDGDVVAASTADIYGKSEEIDQVLDRIWFEVEQFFDKMIHFEE